MSSKFRKMYFAQYYFIFSVVIIGLLISLVNAFENGECNFKSTAFFLGGFFAILLFFSLFDFYTISKITITENGIENQTLLFHKKTFLLFSEIKKIEFQIERSQSDAGYINDGYPVSIITFKNDSVLIISSNCYENYQELMLNINRAFNEQQ